MRRRRLARLAGLETNIPLSNTDGSNLLNSPSTPGPSSASTVFPITTLNQTPPTPQQPQNDQLDVAMDTEETSEKQCNSSGIDVDSGIENMEVEESDRKENASRSRVNKLI